MNSNRTVHGEHRRGMSRLALVWLIACLGAGGWLVGSALRPMPAEAQESLSEPSPQQYVLKNIEDVKAGELVWAYDTVARRWCPKPVGIVVHNKCFARGTRVLMADGSSQAIETIRLGEYVLAKDHGDAGPPTPHQVIALLRNWTDHWVHVKVTGGGEVEATGLHPFWVEGKGWIDAKDLVAGELLEGEQGQTVLIKQTWVENQTTATFNLTIEGVHTYYVLAGDVPVLVHNSYPTITPVPHEPFNAPEGYTPSPYWPGDPYNPQSVSQRQSDLRRYLNTGDNDPDSPIPDQGPGSNIKGSHAADPGTPHDSGERNVNTNEEHSRVGKGSGGKS